MASSSAASQSQAAPPQFPPQQPNSQHHCKECGLFFDSAKSLEVHLQYHKENLLNKWATQASATLPDEANNNTSTKANNNNKRQEFSAAVAAAADSSDARGAGAAAKSPDSPYGSRTTPETVATSFGHPPTPQSYSSAPSPYADAAAAAAAAAAFSPSYAAGQQQRGPSPLYAYPPHHQHHQHMFEAGAAAQFAFAAGVEHAPYAHDYPAHKAPPPQPTPAFRYHPYHHGYERVSSSSAGSPAYPAHNPQPTPSPSPKQCDKCGFVCDSAAQLIDHINHTHPPTPAPYTHHHPHAPHLHHHHSPSHHPQHFHGTAPCSGGGPSSLPGPAVADIKTEQDEQQTEILDLDSHKVHQVFQQQQHESEDESMKRHNGDVVLNGPHPHPVSAMLGHGWTHHHHPHRAMFADTKPLFQPEQKLFQPHQLHEFAANGVSTTTTTQADPTGTTYRPFEHMAAGAQGGAGAPVISSSAPAAGNQQQSKGANWKSNEARRPKTYNCSACNKWFTSSGHLKRHYNTTLHKNAVKSSGQPDPATMPISAHHHPGREPSNTARPAAAPEPVPSDPLDDELLPYATAAPPNGDAGPSVHSSHSSRGLLSMSSTTPMVATMSPSQQHPAAFQPAAIPSSSSSSSSSSSNSSSSMSHQHQQHMMVGGGSPAAAPAEQQQQPAALFQNMSPPSGLAAAPYPNALAPHVTPAATAISSPAQASTSQTITGSEPELFQLYECGEITVEQQPLPSFAQFQPQRYQLLLAAASHANVGGLAPVTDAPPPSITQHHHHHHHHQTLYAAPYATLYAAAVASPASPRAAASLDDYELTQLADGAPDDSSSQSLPPYAAHSPAPAAAAPVPPPLQRVDFDEETGSPSITSTGSPLAARTAPASLRAARSAPSSLHKCFDCDKVFNKACYLTQHNKTFHCGDKPFKCSRCGKRFPSDGSYQEHLAKHAGDKPYKCELCPKQFNHKTDLRRHMCLHTGQKPYACDHCGKGFIRKDHMLKHAETHTRKTISAKNGGGAMQQHQVQQQQAQHHVAALHHQQQQPPAPATING